jgi:hypothetical protein
VCSCSSASYKYHEWGYFPSFCNEDIYKWLVFCSFHADGFFRQHVIEYVTSINCMVSSRVRVVGGGLLYGWPIMHSMLGLSLALQGHR